MALFLFFFLDCSDKFKESVTFKGVKEHATSIDLMSWFGGTEKPYFFKPIELLDSKKKEQTDDLLVTVEHDCRKKTIKSIFFQNCTTKNGFKIQNNQQIEYNA